MIDSERIMRPVAPETSGPCALCKARDAELPMNTTLGMRPEGGLCAFDTPDRTFRTYNYDCRTMAALRLIATDTTRKRMMIQRVWDIAGAMIPALDYTIDFYTDDDEHRAIGHYIRLCWYKDRGRVSSAAVVGDFDAGEPATLPLTERVALAYVASYKHDRGC
jgi:hypothetical protein